MGVVRVLRSANFDHALKSSLVGDETIASVVGEGLNVLDAAAAVPVLTSYEAARVADWTLGSPSVCWPSGPFGGLSPLPVDKALNSPWAYWPFDLSGDALSLTEDKASESLLASWPFDLFGGLSPLQDGVCRLPGSHS